MLGRIGARASPTNRSERAGSDPACGVWPGGATVSVTLALVYDTAAAGLPAGIRAMVWHDDRQLLFADDEHELLLRVSSAAPDGTSRLAGQVLRGGVPLAGAHVRLLGEPPGPWACTGEAGGFGTEAVPAGGCRIQVVTERGTLETPPIEVGETRMLDVSLYRRP
jgi:hypothetical protein